MCVCVCVCVCVCACVCVCVCACAGQAPASCFALPTISRPPCAEHLPPPPHTHHTASCYCAHAHTPSSPEIISKKIRGIKTNIPFLENVLKHPEFLAGAPTTAFIEKNAKALFA